MLNILRQAKFRKEILPFICVTSIARVRCSSLSDDENQMKSIIDVQAYRPALHNKGPTYYRQQVVMVSIDKPDV
jgi:hypothetical protein